MNEDNRKRLAEWYGACRGVSPVGRKDEPGETADPFTQIPPRRDPGTSPGPGGKRVRRGKHTGARAAGVCVLAVIVIAASALVFSNGGGKAHIARPTPPKDTTQQGMEEFFDDYFDDSSVNEWSSTMPRAELGSGVTLNPAPRPDSEPMDLMEVYAECAESAVAISAELDGGGRLLGTGIIMTDDGYILTNSHVLDGTVSAYVTLWDDTRCEAKLVGADAASDIAVIKIEASGLRAAEFCSDEVRVGEPVAAIGNPLGEELRGTMTDGIISAISRDISYTGHPMTLIQTNAAINEGNSGGALLNMYGQVVGMTSMKLVSSYAKSSIEGIGFAIPVDTLRDVAGQLIANGRVTGRVALGVTVGAVPEQAKEQFKLPDGLLVDSILPESNAAKEGVRAMDVITAVNGQKVFSTAGLSDIIDRLNVGDEVVLTVYRDGETFEVTVRLQEFSDLY